MGVRVRGGVLALSVLVLAGCGSDERVEEGTRTGTDGGFVEDGTPRPRDEPPVGSRPSSDKYVCEVARAPGTPPLSEWSEFGALGVGTRGQPVLARSKSVVDGPSPFVLSSFGVDGTMGTSHAVAPPGTQHGNSVMTTTPAGITMVWAGVSEPLSTEEESFYFTTLSDDGEVVTPRTKLPLLEGPDLFASALAASGGTYGFLYRSLDSFQLRLHFALLDSQGNALAAPRLLAGDNAGWSAIQGVPGGYAVAWEEHGADGMKVNFAILDHSGEYRAGPTQLFSDSEDRLTTFAVTGVSILTNGSGYLVAWTEGQPGTTSGPNSGTGAYRMIRIGRVDAQGELSSAVSWRAVEPDVDQGAPNLVRFGDALALFSARGRHIYACQGCIPNHALQLALLDPETLYPLSNVVTLEPGSEGGGFMWTSAVPVEDTFLLAFRRQFHVTSNPVSAAISCAAR